MPRTFEEVIDIVDPQLQKNILANLNAYRAINDTTKKTNGDKLVSVLKNNFPTLEHSNISGAHGLIQNAYMKLASYTTTMIEMVEVSSPVYGEIFSYLPHETFSVEDYDLNANVELQEAFGFTSTRLEALLNYRNATLASTKILTEEPSYAELMASYGDNVCDTARMIYLAAFTRTSDTYGFDKPLFQASVVDLNQWLVECPVSFEPNSLYCNKYAQSEYMIRYSREVLKIQAGLSNIISSFGNSWVERIMK